MIKVYLTVDPRVVLRKAVSFIFNNLEISNISMLIFPGYRGQLLNKLDLKIVNNMTFLCLYVYDVISCCLYACLEVTHYLRASHRLVKNCSCCIFKEHYKQKNDTKWDTCFGNWLDHENGIRCDKSSKYGYLFHYIYIPLNYLFKNSIRNTLKRQWLIIIIIEHGQVLVLNNFLQLRAFLNPLSLCPS